MHHYILGTAGHIDHGKTTLIRKLTNIDTDRLPEEKKRGITIELGFAHLNLDGNIELGIVDVPGHEKFIHHMVMGVGGMDLVMLIIAADEGVMPQTKEHIEICELLGIRYGLTVITKTDMVNEDWLTLIMEDTQKYLSNTFLANSPILTVSGKTGFGIDQLKNELKSQTQKIPKKSTKGLFRLPIDRVFTIKGFGTVVTGTVISGQKSVSQTVTCMPENFEAKIRGLQVHNDQVNTIVNGQRAAINLQNVNKAMLRRGMVLTDRDVIESSQYIDTFCTFIQQSDRVLKNSTRIRFYYGTEEIIGKIRFLEQETVSTADEVLVQFALEQPASLLPGDRFIVRTYSPLMTIGGGQVINIADHKTKRYDKNYLNFLKNLFKGDDKLKIITHLKAADIDGLSVFELQRKVPDSVDLLEAILAELIESNEILTVSQDPNRFVALANWNAHKQKIIDYLEKNHNAYPYKQGCPKEELKSATSENIKTVIFSRFLIELEQKSKIFVTNRLIKLIDHEPQLDGKQKIIKDKVLNFLSDADVKGIGYGQLLLMIDEANISIDIVLQHLLDTGEVIRLASGLIFSKATIDKFRKQLIQLIQTNGPLSIGQFRDVMNISRKQAVPILEYFDGIGLTRRSGDLRILQ